MAIDAHPIKSNFVLPGRTLAFVLRGVIYVGVVQEARLSDTSDVYDVRVHAESDYGSIVIEATVSDVPDDTPPTETPMARFVYAARAVQVQE